MARKKLAPPTSRRRGARGARRVNLGWWTTVTTIVLVGVVGVLVSRGESRAGRISHTIVVPAIAGATEISVTKVNVAPFDRVSDGDVLMEVKGGDTTRKLVAPVDGIVSGLGASEGQTVAAGAEVARVQTGADFAAHDHWHTAYGVNICGVWQPNLGEFVSDYHTHGDGLLHLHPGSTAAAGKNATLGLFFDRAGLELTATKLEYPSGDGTTTYRTGETMCGEGEDEKDAVLRWAVNGEEQEGNPANFVAGNGDVVAIAFVPKDAELDTLPPSTSHMAESYVPAKHPDFQGTTTPTPFPTDAPAEEEPATTETTTTETTTAETTVTTTAGG